MLKIKKFAILLTVLTLLVNTACKTKAQQTKPINTASTAPMDTKSLLWEISGKGLKKPSYLYGTIHLIPKKDFFLTDATKKAFEASQKVTFEINMKEMNNPMAMMSIFTKALIPNGKKLKDFLNDEDYGLVQRKFDSLGLPLKMLERVKPMFLSVMVGSDGEQIPMDGSTKESNKSTSYEMEFLKMGETQKKEFGGLETVEFQMGIFDSIPYQAQADMLVKTIKNGGSGNNELAKMIEMYKNQDIEAMCQMLKSGDESELGNYENMLLNNRNINWIPLMSKAMIQKSTFFAVGAGHLGGEKGVVNLLKKAGYTVKPLK
jgi:uncharacterized protein